MDAAVSKLPGNALLAKKKFSIDNHPAADPLASEDIHHILRFDIAAIVPKLRKCACIGVVEDMPCHAITTF